METYFDLIPKELTNVILSYVDTYESFVNLYKLTNLYINLVLTNKFFWTEYLKDRLDEIYEYIPEFSNKISVLIDNKILKFYYLSSHTFRILKAYKLAINIYNKMLKEVNKEIQKYYPNMTLDNINYDKISEDDNDDNLMDKGSSINLTGKFISDLSIFYTSEKAMTGELIELSDYVAAGMTIRKIILFMTYNNYSALLLIFDKINSDHVKDIFIPSLTKEEYIGLLMQACFNGLEEIEIKKIP